MFDCFGCDGTGEGGVYKKAVGMMPLPGDEDEMSSKGLQGQEIKEK